MESSRREQITQILNQVKSGNKSAQDALFHCVYSELKRMAAVRLRRERQDHTLQPTALVHEAYLRLVGGQVPNWQNRSHFFAAAAHAMRHVLVDHARKTRAAKRGGGLLEVELGDFVAGNSPKTELILAVHDALERLNQHSPRLCSVVEMRFYAGFTEEEIAEILQVSSRTVKRDWKTAQAWLHGEIRGSNGK